MKLTAHTPQPVLLPGVAGNSLRVPQLIKCSIRSTNCMSVVHGALHGPWFCAECDMSTAEPLLCNFRPPVGVTGDLVHFMPAMMMRLFSTGVEHRATTRETL